MWQLIGFTVVSLAGTLLHFLYAKTGRPIAALISSVNESTWEHMKLLFFPMLGFALIQRIAVDRTCENFWCIKLLCILLGLALIPTLFYTLGGIFGPTPGWVNILIFFVASALPFGLEAALLRRENIACPSPALPLIALALLTLAFFVFTFSPPEIPLFRDPTNDSYGFPRPSRR